MNWHVSASFGELLTTWRTRRNLTQTDLATSIGAHRNTIGRWERGEVLPETRGIVLELARKLRLDEQETRSLLEASLTALVPHWTVPFRRNSSFTGRETLLELLHTRLATAQPVALIQTSALSGLGGIGKTQLAVEYAYRYGLEYRAVFWLAAETIESLMASVQQIALQLQLPDYQATDQLQIVALVQRWLITHTNWLLIVDNVEDLDLLQSVLPPTPQGALLLTTRRQALGHLAELLEVPPMKNEEGVALLLQRAHRSGIAGEEAAAIELVLLLEGLPLALDQAGAYIEETGCSVATYLHLAHTRRRQVLAHRGTHGGNHPASVTTTLQLSVEHVDREHPAAADLLRVCAFLPAEAIPEELLVAGASHLGPALGPVLADPYQFNLVLAALRNASLVTRHPESRTLSIHRLVQAVLQDQMEPASARLWSTRIICALNAAFPVPDFSAWAQCERYLEQALGCTSLLALVDSDLPETGELLFKAGSYVLARGRYEEAQPLLVQTLPLYEKRYGRDQPALIPLLLKQGELSLWQGKLAEAELFMQRALTIGERHPDPVHLQLAETFNDLAVLYWNQSKYQETEQFLLRALHIREQQLGPEHPDTALTLNNLAALYQTQKQRQQAEPLYQRALRIQEQCLGTDHPQTALTLNNLASLYRDQGAYAQAEPLYQRALRIREQQLGPEHLETAITLNNLALLYRNQGAYVQAEPLYQRVLHIREQQLGVDHPRTLQTRADYRAFLAQKEAESEQDPSSGALVHQKPFAEDDPLRDFLTDCCELHPQAWSQAGGLWQAYEHWVKERQGHFLLSRRAFADALKARGFRAARTNSTRLWRGIAVRQQGGQSLPQ